MNTFGSLFRVTTFGESHGPALGAVVDGCPAGVPFDAARLQAALDRRRPGQSSLTTPRKEPDQGEILSGVYQDRTLGTPLAVVIRNHDPRSQDYQAPAARNRPGHADAAWRTRFGHVDPRGGGRTSGRETVGRVIGGAVAEAFLAQALPECRVVGWVSQVGPLVAPEPPADLDRAGVDRHPVRCPDPEVAEAMAARILAARDDADTLGGAIDLRITGLPVGLGEPVFGKLKSRLAEAMASVGAVSGVVWPPDLLSRLDTSGSEFHRSGDAYGGIQGGLSSGAPVRLRVYVKPPSSLGEVARQGRHDPTILPRAVPVLEAMASLVLADLWLQHLAHPHRP